MKMNMYFTSINIKMVQLVEIHYEEKNNRTCITIIVNKMAANGLIIQDGLTRFD